MIKCMHCGKEFAPAYEQIVAVSSDLMEAVVLCYYCGKETVEKMVSGGVKP